MPDSADTERATEVRILHEMLAQRDSVLLDLYEEIASIHWDRHGYCNECGGNFPCSTARLLPAYEGTQIDGRDAPGTMAP